MITIAYLAIGLLLGLILGSTVTALYKEGEKRKLLAAAKDETDRRLAEENQRAHKELESRLAEARQQAHEEMERYDKERDQYQNEQMRLQQENHLNMITLMRESHSQDMQRQQERLDETINHLKAEMKAVTEEMQKK